MRTAPIPFPFFLERRSDECSPVGFSCFTLPGRLRTPLGRETRTLPACVFSYWDGERGPACFLALRLCSKGPHLRLPYAAPPARQFLHEFFNTEISPSETKPETYYCIFARDCPFSVVLVDSAFGVTSKGRYAEPTRRFYKLGLAERARIWVLPKNGVFRSFGS